MRDQALQDLDYAIERLDFWKFGELVLGCTRILGIPDNGVSREGLGNIEGAKEYSKVPYRHGASL